MDQLIQDSVIRIQTGAAWAQPDCVYRQKSPREVRKSGWSPVEALKWKKGCILNQQGKWESRRAFVLAPWEARIPCVIEDAEVAGASHDKIEVESLLQRLLSHSTPTVSQEQTILFFTDGSGYEDQVEAVHFAFVSDALHADRTESLLVQIQGGRIR
jgi:hypothetical protein